MSTGKPQAGLLREPGKAMLQLALPIRYRLTEQTEGGVILRIPLASLLGPSNAINGHWLKDSDG